MFTINGEVWQVKRVFPGHPMLVKPNGDWAIGVCDDWSKTIFIDKTLHGKLFKEVLCHEITHAAMFSHNVELSQDEEELIANIIAKFGHEIISVTDKMFKKIQRGYY